MATANRTHEILHTLREWIEAAIAEIPLGANDKAALYAALSVTVRNIDQTPKTDRRDAT